MEQLMLVNPTKRKRKKNPGRRPKRRVLTKRRGGKGTIKRDVRRRRRNPTAPPIMGQIQNAAIGAAGALAVDVAMANLPIPAHLTVNQVKTVLKSPLKMQRS